MSVSNGCAAVAGTIAAVAVGAVSVAVEAIALSLGGRSDSEDTSSDGSGSGDEGLVEVHDLKEGGGPLDPMYESYPFVYGLASA